MTLTRTTDRPLSLNLSALALLALAGCEMPLDADLVDAQLSEHTAFDDAEIGARLVLRDSAPTFQAYGDPPEEDAPEDVNDSDAGGDDPTDDGSADPESITQQPPVWDGDFVANSDAELVAFCADGYHTVLGSVQIGGAVTDVSGMDCLVSLRADLQVRFAPGITRMDGFPQLVEVGGDIDIANLSGLTVLTGFDALQVLDGSLRVTECRSLREIAMASSLPEVGADVALRWNDLVDSIDMLGAAERFGGDWVLERFGVLGQMPEASVLGVVEGDVHVFDNPSLESVEILVGLDKIGGDLVIDENPALGSAAAEELGAEMADRVGGLVLLGRNGE